MAERLKGTLPRRARCGPRPIEPLLNFASKFEIDETTGCWNWTAGTANGYGIFNGSGRLEETSLSRLAHRYLYLRTVGPIPGDLALDHLCRNRRCVNPDHLEPVTLAENNRRAGAAITHCKYGHEFDEASTYVDPTGRRSCRICAKLKQRRMRAAAKEAVGLLTVGPADTFSHTVVK